MQESTGLIFKEISLAGDVNDGGVEESFGKEEEAVVCVHACMHA